MKRKGTNGSRKVAVPVMLTATDLKWLEKRKVQLKLKSRSAVIRYVIAKDIENRE